MTVYVSVKKPGRERNAVEATAFPLPDEFMEESPGRTVGDLLDAVTAECLRRFASRCSGKREKGSEDELLRVLSPEETGGMAASGKISFGPLSALSGTRNTVPPLEEAQRNSRQCYGDGLFALFIDGEEVAGLDQSAPLDAPVCLKEGSSVTFIRLAMLAGRMW